jgi:hypothetical protein
VCFVAGFLLALGLDPNLNPYHQTLTTFTTLQGADPTATVMAAKPATPYEVRVTHMHMHSCMLLRTHAVAQPVSFDKPYPDPALYSQ